MTSPGEDTFGRRLTKTLLIGGSFFAMGLVDAARGPTLLDLGDLTNATVAQISYIFPAFSCGSIGGSLITGYLFDRYPSQRLLGLSLIQAVMSLSSGLLPTWPSLWSICLISVFQGATLGAVDAGGTALCLDIWRGHRSDPYLYAIHFTNSVGSFIAPLLAAPFLADQGQETNIQALYAIIAGVCAIVAIGFTYLHFSCKEVLPDHEDASVTTLLKGGVAVIPEESRNNSTSMTITCIILSAFFFIYVGSEVTFGSLLSTFCTMSKLALDRRQAAMITSVFWGCLAGARLVAVIASLVAAQLKAGHVLTVDLLTCAIGAIILCAGGGSNLPALVTGSALTGIGMASTFAAGLLWLEQFRAVSSRLAAIFSVAGSIGADIFPLIIGQFITAWPMSLMCLMVVSVAANMVLIAAGAVIVREGKICTS